MEMIIGKKIINLFDLKYAIQSKILLLFCGFLFNKLGKKVSIISPLKIKGFSNISLGDGVKIQYKSWIEALPLTELECRLTINDGVIIGHFSHIYATHDITIGKNVLIADKVYISDNLHSFEDITIPILKQPIKQLNSVYIGDNTWIGENVCILGVTIGKNCVIGANSVVKKNIPDYSIAVGAPAIVIKRYDFNSQTWRKTNKEGFFV